MRILIIRHADPEYHGDTLTEHGWDEARALAKHLAAQKEEGKGKVTRIFTSPMGRARATASCTEEATGLTAEVQDWTRELSYWPRLQLNWGGKEDAGAGAGKGGEGGLAVWDIPAEVVRATPDVTTLNEFARLPPIASVSDQYAQLCEDSDKFLRDLGYSREPDGAYKILKRNRDVRAFWSFRAMNASILAARFSLTVAFLRSMPLPSCFHPFLCAPGDRLSPYFATEDLA